MDRRIALSLALAVVLPVGTARPLRGEERRLTLAARDFQLGPELVEDEKDGSVRLAHSLLVADEMGATDFHQSEELSERLWAKKVFLLDSADLAGAELFLFGSARQIAVNGKPVSTSERLLSTGWTRARVPPELLRAGENEVVFSGGGGLLVEPCRKSGRSFKSTDGGRSWSNDGLGNHGDQPGEYLVRLRLARHAPRGAALSPVLDLWAAGAGPVATPGKLVAFHSLATLPQQPTGTRLRVSMRTGTSPAPDARTWTDWFPLDNDHQSLPTAAAQRWAQLRFEFRTDRPQATPRLPAGFDVTFTFQPESATGEYRCLEGRSDPIARTSVRFVYQESSPRLQLLRERYHLDQVTAPGKTEMEQLMLLRYWVRNQWHSAWGSHPANWMPPWDALVILESKDQPDCLTMCTHYATVFTQCCLALGWNARQCILDHHCVAEVWVEQHHKWVMMDAGNSHERADVGLHFERQGVPQSARELQGALRSGKTDGLLVCFTPSRLSEKIVSLCRPVQPGARVPPRPDTVPLAELHKYPVCQLDNYRRYAFPGRNNFLGSLYPGELYQGWSEYFYDGYWWVGDARDEPQTAPEYSQHLAPARARDVDWELNATRVHLCRTAKAGELGVEVETETPNLARLERWLEAGGKGTWQTVPAGFAWQLQPGENVLRVRSVNRWERSGAEARVRVQWTGR